MAIVGDIIKVSFLQELDGRQMLNTAYWQIDDIGTDLGNFVNLQKIITFYHDAIKALLSDQWKLVCGVLDNVTTPEGNVTEFVSLVGTSLNDSHPQYQVLRFNSWGPITAGGKVHVNAWNQSGIQEGLSTRSRINNETISGTMQSFLQGQEVLPTGGWTIDPQIRINSTPPPAAPTIVFFNVFNAKVNPNLRTLGRRKTKLCATS